MDTLGDRNPREADEEAATDVVGLVSCEPSKGDKGADDADELDSVFLWWRDGIERGAT